MNRTPQRRRNRSRKPTGTHGEGLSKFVASYHRGEQVAEGAGSKPRSRLRSLALALTLLAAGGVFVWLSHVSEVRVVGAEDSVASQLHDDAESRFQFFWQVHDSSLEGFRALHRSDISSVGHRREWLDRRLVLVVEPRQLMIRWRSGDEEYLVDDLGVAVEKADSSDLPLVVDQASLPVEEGEQIAPVALVEFVSNLHSSDSLDIESMRIVETTGELMVGVGGGYDVRMSTAEDLDVQLDNISRIQDVASSRGDVISQYIDVRIPHKGYYR